MYDFLEGILGNSEFILARYEPHAFLLSENSRLAMQTYALGLVEVNFQSLFTDKYDVGLGLCLLLSLSFFSPLLT